MATWMIEYTYDHQSEERDRVRPDHRAYLAELSDRGVMRAYGRFEDDGEPGGLLICEAESRDEVEALIASDPYSQSGLIAHARIRHWPAVFPSPRP